MSVSLFEGSGESGIDYVAGADLAGQDLAACFEPAKLAIDDRLDIAEMRSERVQVGRDLLVVASRGSRLVEERLPRR